VLLTGLAPRTLATLADPSRRDDRQASIHFFAPLLHTERLPGRTVQPPIWLEGEVSTREAASFPGQGHSSRSISLRGSRRVGSLLLCGQASRCKLGRAHRLRMKLMPQFQAKVPHPLGDDLPTGCATSFTSSVKWHEGILQCSRVPIRQRYF
jgi:hypothetical protein